MGTGSGAPQRHSALTRAPSPISPSLRPQNMRLSEANRTLEQRRQMDMEGFAADVTALRRALSTVDRKLLSMRLVERCAGGGV